MNTGRLEAFSDGVLAIVITIMVLEIKVPDGASIEKLKPILPMFLTYVLSFIYLAIYWNNHHHLLQAVNRVNGKNFMGKPKLIVLAFTFSFRYRLDGQTPF